MNNYPITGNKKRSMLGTLAFLILAGSFFGAGWIVGKTMDSDEKPENVIVNQPSDARNNAIASKAVTSRNQKDKSNQSAPEASTEENRSEQSSPEKQAQSMSSRDSEEITDSQQEDNTTAAAEEPKDITKNRETAADAPSEQADTEIKEEEVESEFVYSVQVASFKQENRAEKMAADLKAAGYSPCIVRMWDTQQENVAWYVVQIGEYTDIVNARGAAKAFRRTEGTAPIVRKMYREVLAQRKYCP